MKLVLRGITIAVGGVLVFLGLGLVFAASQWDVWARKGLERQLSRVLDAPVTVGAVVTRPMTRSFEIADLTISNPRTFDVGPAIEVPKVSVEFDPSTVLASRVVFPRIDAEGARIHLHYLPGTGSNVNVLMERARAWREASHWGLRPPAYRVDVLTSTQAELTTYALGKSATIPLGDVTLKELESEDRVSMGAMAAAMLRRTIDETLATETVIEGVRERLGEEFEKWMGKTPM